MEEVKVIDGRYYRLCNTLRYAQEKGGQKLHLVYELGGDSVSRRALLIIASGRAELSNRGVLAEK